MLIVGFKRLSKDFSRFCLHEVLSLIVLFHAPARLTASNDVYIVSFVSLWEQFGATDLHLALQLRVERFQLLVAEVLKGWDLSKVLDHLILLPDFLVSDEFTPAFICQVEEVRILNCPDRS